MCWIICRIKRQLLSYKMTPILFWNIKWLFVRFTFCHRTPVTLDTQWQNAHTFLERINLRYTAEHGKLSSMCPPFTRTTAFSLSCHLSMDLLMICWSRLSQQVRTLSLRSPGWKLECNTRSAAKLPRQHSRRFDEIRPIYAAGTWQLTSLDETACRPVETRNDRGTSDECPEEDIAAVVWR